MISPNPNRNSTGAERRIRQSSEPLCFTGVAYRERRAHTALWYCRQDSNLQPHASKARALSLRYNSIYYLPLASPVYDNSCRHNTALSLLHMRHNTPCKVMPHNPGIAPSRLKRELSEGLCYFFDSFYFVYAPSFSAAPLDCFRRSLKCL